MPFCRPLVCFALIALLVPPASVLAVTFTPLGTLPNGGFFSYVRAVADDGSSVGHTFPPVGSQVAARWNASGAITALGNLGTNVATSPSGISDDGSTIIGTNIRAENSQSVGGEAFRWTAGAGSQGLGFPRGRNSSSAGGVSANGSVVVGNSYIATMGPGFEMQSLIEAFRWTASAGLQSLGYLPGGLVPESSATDVSADGAVVVGVSSSTIRGGYLEAFRWTAAGGMQGLGVIPGGLGSSASAVSADGTAVVGTAANAPNNQEAFVWTQATGMVGLGDLPGGSRQSYAYGVCGDGTIVVGSSYGDLDREYPFIWDATHGMRNLADVLTSRGVDLTGWRLFSAVDISTDGRFIAGNGRNPLGGNQAWIVDLNPTAVPEPATWVLTLGAVGMVTVVRRRNRNKVRR